VACQISKALGELAELDARFRKIAHAATGAENRRAQRNEATDHRSCWRNHPLGGSLYLLSAEWSFSSAQTTGTAVVMTLNFFLNNAVTYRHRRLRGARLLVGLISFYPACSIGVLFTIREATLAASSGTPSILPVVRASSLALCGIMQSQQSLPVASSGEWLRWRSVR